MSDSCIDDEIIDSLRKSNAHRKCMRNKDRGRIFIVRRTESKNCANENDSNRSLKSNSCPKQKPQVCRGEMSCGDHAPPKTPTMKTCQLKITEPIICTICSPADKCESNNSECNISEDVPTCPPEPKKCKERCTPKLNVKKTSRVQLSAPTCANATATRCSCGCNISEEKANLARKLLGPFPDEIGLSFMDRLVRIVAKMKSCGCRSPPSCHKIQLDPCSSPPQKPPTSCG